eukprot:jgi/Bigna1/68603/fgenesh1_pg.6_\
MAQPLWVLITLASTLCIFFSILGGQRRSQQRSASRMPLRNTLVRSAKGVVRSGGRAFHVHTNWASTRHHVSRRGDVMKVFGGEKEELLSAKKGDLVQIHFSVENDETGEKFMNTWEIGRSGRAEPMDVILGENRLIPIMENIVLGMKPGERRSKVYEEGVAFGPYKDDLVVEIDRAQVPPGVGIGCILEVPGNSFAKLLELRSTSAIVDLNNPLAGKRTKLTFELLTIKDAPQPFTELQIKTLAPGTGEIPEDGNAVYFHYTGYFRDGMVFISTREEDNPNLAGRLEEPHIIILGQGQAVKGIEMTLKQMREGERARVNVPSHLAYGEEGVPGMIPKNCSLQPCCRIRINGVLSSAVRIESLIVAHRILNLCVQVFEIELLKVRKCGRAIERGGGVSKESQRDLDRNLYSRRVPFHAKVERLTIENEERLRNEKEMATAMADDSVVEEGEGGLKEVKEANYARSFSADGDDVVRVLRGTTKRSEMTRIDNSVSRSSSSISRIIGHSRSIDIHLL